MFSLLLKPFTSILLNGLAIYFVTTTTFGVIYSGGLKFFVLAGAILGLLNFIVKPILKIFGLPFIILSAGFFLIVINIFILWFLRYILDILQFQDVTLVFNNWQSYVIGAIVLGIANWILSLFD